MRCTVFITLFVLALAGNDTFFERKSSIVEFEHIVKFREYITHEKHKDILTGILGLTGWQLVQRKSALLNFPSDFALIKVSADQELRILQELSRAPLVKRVFPQRRYVSILNEAEQDFEIFEPLKLDGRFHADIPNLTEEIDDFSPQMRRLHDTDTSSITDLFGVHQLWEKGFTGKGVKVAVFDTGLRQGHPHFKNIVLTHDWTDENSSEDLLGHGTFVAGIIGSQSDCLGFAPDAELYAFRVFTTKKVSYTTWFLDAFNHAIQLGIHILNLSIGGPDFNDYPFVEKVWEMSANKIIVISAIGNDGPTYGTLNNPADQLDVIGVGGINFKNRLSRFSSRGMTTWELPDGYGRVKPDILAYAQSVRSSTPSGDCKILSGTSVASPVVAGAVALLASTVPEKNRWDIINPASMKQVLIEGTVQIGGANIFEQGYGKLDVLNSYKILQEYTPRVTFSPPQLDLTNCPYMWPYCTQPLYYTGLPTIVNVTLLNGVSITSGLASEPTWIPGTNGHHLQISFTYSQTFWPWSGYLALHIRVSESAAHWTGQVEGIVRVNVTSVGETAYTNVTVELPLKVNVIPTPPREQRILWDQFHNLRYPSGYFPRDVLKMVKESFDWNGDHLHTNFKDLYDNLRSLGYFIEVLGHPFTCFDASYYGTLLIVDPEEEFFAEEITKLHTDVEFNGLSVIVVADWYNTEVMKTINFFDENTKQYWTPVTGGSNVPALNDLLKKYHIAFGDHVYDGKIALGKEFAYFASGTGIATFPSGGILVPFELTAQSNEILYKRKETHKVPIIGLYEVKNFLENVTSGSSDKNSVGNSGRIAVFGDSSCLDTANKYVDAPCFWLLNDLLDFSSKGKLPQHFTIYPPLTGEFISQRLAQPERLEGNKLYMFSKVIDKTASCSSLNFVNGSSDDSLVISWRKPGEDKESGLFKEQTSYRTPSSNPPQIDISLHHIKSSWWLPIFLLVVSVAILLAVWRRRSFPFGISTSDV